MKYLVFLGNPGSEYENTRHNAGFMIGDCLAARDKIEWQRKNNFIVARAPDFWLIKPRTFMNLSGEIFRWLPDFKIEDLLITVDDVALPLGKIRLRQNGSAGGHNGLKSIAAALNSCDFPRLRFGVGDGNAVNGDRLVGQVLGNFSAVEREQLPTMIARAADACRDWKDQGIKFCQDRYN